MLKSFFFIYSGVEAWDFPALLVPDLLKGKSNKLKKIKGILLASGLWGSSNNVYGFWFYGCWDYFQNFFCCYQWSKENGYILLTYYLKPLRIPFLQVSLISKPMPSISPIKVLLNIVDSTGSVSTFTVMLFVTRRPNLSGVQDWDHPETSIFKTSTHGFSFWFLTFDQSF